MKRTNPAKSVDEYLDALPDPVRITLEKVRQTIKSAAPKAEEVISYQIPTYKYFGPLVHFAAYTNHCSLYGVDKELLKTFEKELKPFKTAGSTIHFSVEKPLPVSLIKKIVKHRVKKNEERTSVVRNSKKGVR